MEIYSSRKKQICNRQRVEIFAVRLENYKREVYNLLSYNLSLSLNSQILLIIAQDGDEERSGLREDVETSNAKNEIEGGYRILVILVIAW